MSYGSTHKIEEYAPVRLSENIFHFSSPSVFITKTHENIFDISGRGVDKSAMSEEASSLHNHFIWYDPLD